MNSTLTVHLGDLADALRDLRRRFREAARIEVARAIGEALREMALATICGPVRHPSRGRSAYDAWDDPWRDPGDPWQAQSAYDPEIDLDQEDRHGALRLPPALMAGLGAARWGFMRTRQIVPAFLIGLLVALAAYVSGPTLKAVLTAWSAATDLLS